MIPPRALGASRTSPRSPRSTRRSAPSTRDARELPPEAPGPRALRDLRQGNPGPVRAPRAAAHGLPRQALRDPARRGQALRPQHPGGPPVIALALAALLAAQVPSPPTGWTRAEVEQTVRPADLRRSARAAVGGGRRHGQLLPAGRGRERALPPAPREGEGRRLDGARLLLGRGPARGRSLRAARGPRHRLRRDAGRAPPAERGRDMSYPPDLTDKRKQSLYFPEDMLREIQAEAQRQDRSLSLDRSGRLAAGPGPGSRAARVTMTLSKIAPWVVAVVASVVAVGALVWALNRGRTSSRELARVNEERRLELAGLNVAHQVERDAILQDLIGEATANAKLSEELARIQAAAPGAKPVATAHGSTPWKPVGPAASSPPAVIPPASPGSPASPVPALCAACPACRLVVGDELQVRASGAVLSTDLGNYLVAATAAVWRRPAGGTGPEEELHQEALKLEVSVPVQGAGPGWGFGPLVGVRSVAPAAADGFVGGMAATPSVRLLFGVEGSLVAGGGVGPSGGGGGFLGRCSGRGQGQGGFSTQTSARSMIRHCRPQPQLALSAGGARRTSPRLS